MRYFIYLTLLLSTSIQAGSIQKWVDEEGNVHYGDAPPISAKTEQIKIQGVPTNTGKALPRLNTGGSEGEPASGNNETEIDSNGLPKDDAQIACDRAKEDLKVIKRSKRIKLRSADGTSRLMTPEEIEERRKNAEADVKSFCN